MEYGVVLILFVKVLILFVVILDILGMLWFYLFNYVLYCGSGIDWVISMRVMLFVCSNDLCVFCFLVNDCGKFYIFYNGFLFGNKIIFFNFVIYICDEGFILKGFKIRYC